MSKANKIWLIVATALLFLGVIIFSLSLNAVDYDFTNLSNIKYETNTFEISETFNDINIDIDVEDIVFQLSENGECKVVCFEEQNVKHNAFVENGCLIIDIEDKRELLDYINFFSFSSPKITIYLPSYEYGELLITTSTGDVNIPKDFTFQNIDINGSTSDVTVSASAHNTVKIKADTGDINISDVTAKNVDLEVSTGEINAVSINCEEQMNVVMSTGDVTLGDIACKKLLSNSSTGDLTLNNVIATEKIEVYGSSSDIDFRNCDSADIYVNVSTGDVEGTLLTDKIFITKTSTGDINVPQSAIGGKCEIITSTGDIEISIP